MTIRIATVTVEAGSPRVVADFWSAMLGYREVDHPTDSIRLDDPSGIGPTLLVQPGRPKSSDRKNRIHLDLRPDDQPDAVRQALELGAAHVDVGQSGDEPWIVLVDPDGNEFCILQSADDLAQRTLDPT